jgi:hypothetical protein
MDNMRIIDSIKRQTVADDCMTAALEAIETYDWEEALKQSHAVLKSSESIEQRLAAMMLLTVANSRRKFEVDLLLQTIYDYE